MAGIGFKIQKILQKESYLSFAKGVLYSASISAGPWILTVISLFGVQIIAEFFDFKDIDLFRGGIIYSFCISGILSGAIQLLFTRYISDRIFLKEFQKIPASHNLAIIVSFIVCIPFQIFYIFFSTDPLFFQISFCICLPLLTSLWTTMSYLTATSNPKSILISYSIGILLGNLFAILLGNIYGGEGLMIGYCIGFAIIWAMASSRIYKEYDSNLLLPSDAMKHLTDVKSYAVIGFLYYLGFWADKISYWIWNENYLSGSLFYTNPLYEIPDFLASFSILPSLCFFLIVIETDFYKNYVALFNGMMEKKSYRYLQNCIEKMQLGLSRNMYRLIGIQGAITLTLFIFAEHFFRFIDREHMIAIFRIDLLGHFVHTLFLFEILIILYFDRQKLVLYLTFFFCITNFILNYYFISLGDNWIGYGRFITSFIFSLIGLYYLKNSLEDILYNVFALQAIPQEKIKK